MKYKTNVSCRHFFIIRKKQTLLLYFTRQINTYNIANNLFIVPPFGRIVLLKLIVTTILDIKLFRIKLNVHLPFDMIVIRNIALRKQENK